MKLRISQKAVCRSLLAVYENKAPLTEVEAEQVRIALENSGVRNATTRLIAGYARLILKQVA